MEVTASHAGAIISFHWKAPRRNARTSLEKKRKLARKKIAPAGKRKMGGKSKMLPSVLRVASGWSSMGEKDLERAVLLAR